MYFFQSCDIIPRLQKNASKKMMLHVAPVAPRCAQIMQASSLQYEKSFDVATYSHVEHRHIMLQFFFFFCARCALDARRAPSCLLCDDSLLYISSYQYHQYLQQ